MTDLVKMIEAEEAKLGGRLTSSSALSEKAEIRVNHYHKAANKTGDSEFAKIMFVTSLCERGGRASSASPGRGRLLDVWGDDYAFDAYAVLGGSDDNEVVVAHQVRHVDLLTGQQLPPKKPGDNLAA